MTTDGHADLRSIVFRLTRRQRDAVNALARDSKISRSVLLREAIDDMLRRHAWRLEER